MSSRSSIVLAILGSAVGCSADGELFDSLLNDLVHQRIVTTTNELEKYRGGSNGAFNYCSRSLCVAGEGDCDSHSECVSGTICMSNVGLRFGAPWSYDYCLGPHCNNGVLDGDETAIDAGGSCGSPCPSVGGTESFCTTACPCSVGEGDCDNNAECAAGLVCGTNNGPAFGMVETFAACVAPACANGQLDSGELGIDCGGPCGLCWPRCGNAIVDPGEACDDGNQTAGDGCEPNCTSQAAAPIACNTSPPPISGSAGGLIDAGPLVYYRSPDEMSFWVAPINVSQDVHVGFTAAGEPECWASLPPSTNGESTQIVLSSLRPNTIYTYRLIVGGVQASGFEGSFRTGVAVGSAFQARFATATCNDINDYPVNQNGWSALATENPVLTLELGDTHYANSTVPATLRDKNMRQRRIPEYAAAHRQFAVMSTYDDHDYCGNDMTVADCIGDAAQSVATWREFWGADYELSSGSIYHKAQYGNVEIYMLDCRNERDANSDVDDASKQFLGPAQWSWLESNLAASTAAFKLIGCGSTLELSRHDGWSKYTAERARLYALTRTIPGIVFLTGDVHSAIVERRTFASSIAGYPIYDIVSSGIATFNDSGNNWRWYVRLDVDTTRADPQINVVVRRYDPQLVLRDQTPNAIASSAEYLTQYSVSHTIKLSELQPPLPGVPWAMSVTGDGHSVADHPDFSVGQHASGCMWVMPRTLVNGAILWSKFSATDRSFRLDTRSTGQWTFAVNSTSRGFFETTVDCALATSAYNLICWTYDGAQSTAANRVRLYQNGVECATTGGGSMPATMNDSTVQMRIGASGAGTDALIDDVVLFDATLSAASIASLHAEYVSGVDRNWCDEAGAIAVWQHEESFEDCTGHGHDGQRLGLPYFAQDPAP